MSHSWGMRILRSLLPIGFHPSYNMHSLPLSKAKELNSTRFDAESPHYRIIHIPELNSFQLRLIHFTHSFTGSNKDSKRVLGPRRKLHPPLPRILWNRRWIPLFHRRLPLPRLQIPPRNRIQNPGRRHPMAHLLGRILLLLHD